LLSCLSLLGVCLARHEGLIIVLLFIISFSSGMSRKEFFIFCSSLLIVLVPPHVFLSTILWNYDVKPFISGQQYLILTTGIVVMWGIAALSLKVGGHFHRLIKSMFFIAVSAAVC